MEVHKLPIPSGVPAPDLYTNTRTFYKNGTTRTLAWRKQQILSIREMLITHESEFIEALKTDLNKPRFESYSADIGGVHMCINQCLKNLENWTKEVTIERQDVFTMGCPTTVKFSPYGVAFVIGTWNYPVNLTLTPVVLAIAAGNAVICKPSEVTPACSAVMTKLGNQYLSELGGVVFAEGGREFVQSLMNENRLDFVFYTGGSVGGKAVAKLCAEKLIPSVLELGGKNPVLVDDLNCQEISVNDVARRILWSKVFNSGQICLAADYVIFKSEKDRDTIIQEMKKTIATEWYPKGVTSNEPDYCHLVNERHFDHVDSFVKKLEKDEKFIRIVDCEPDRKNLFYPVTAVLLNDRERLGEVEFFGSAFGCLVIEDFDEAVEFIASKENPLCGYIFTKDEKKVQKFLDGTLSGGVTVNDVMKHAVNETLPFGGVGASGWGQYHGRFGFEAFSHRRSIMRQKSPKQAISLLEPPYLAWKEKYVQQVLMGFSFAWLWSFLNLVTVNKNRLARTHPL